MIRRKSVLVDKSDRVRRPKYCPFCRGLLVIKVLRFKYNYRDDNRIVKRDRYVCEPCGITLRIGPWPPQMRSTSNGWERSGIESDVGQS